MRVMGSIFLLFCVTLSGCRGCFDSQGNRVSSKKNLSVFQALTGEDEESDRNRWDALYNQSPAMSGHDPAQLLAKFIDVIPVGRALDIAMGEGRNAVFLAKKGFLVEGVDFSEVAILRAQKWARENRVHIETTGIDLNQYVIRTGAFDVIVNIDYLQRSLIPQIKKGLKTGGVVVFENATTEQLKNPGGQGLVPEFLLKPGELKEAFSDFQILFYDETNNGIEAKAKLVAVKP